MMKQRLWTQMLAWIAAVAVALLLALAGPDVGSDGYFPADIIPQGSAAPR